MGIEVRGNQFHIYTKDTSYVFAVYQNKYIAHLYWGKKLNKDIDLTYFIDMFCCYRPGAFDTYLDPEKGVVLNDMLLEFSSRYKGDYRTPTIEMEDEKQCPVFEYEYEGYKIYAGKPGLAGLPALYAEDNEAETLEVVLSDNKMGVKIKLIYTSLYQFDIITRHTEVENTGNKCLNIVGVMSASIDFPGNDYKVLHLQGEWLRERKPECVDIKHGTFRIDSKRGMSGHSSNPFIALAEKSANEKNGDVYGIALIYSGNFMAEAEGSGFGTTRINIGINNMEFNWTLEPKEIFTTPEAVLCYSDSGFSKMSSLFHNVIRERLFRGHYKSKERPLIINNWEATRMDFDEEKLLKIAKAGADVGLELFVLDDGWFAERNDDTSSLGDWSPNEKKLPSGLVSFCNKIKALGLEFGIWIEPEMVSPNSNLYREHPDWCVYADGRERTQNRNQLVLDFSKNEVKEYIKNTISELLENTEISYIKWDCNRNLSEIPYRGYAHKYMLGVYEVMEYLTNKFPHILFEGCSGGGGRFDLGILYYMPQIWTSDNTEPVSRIFIQNGTSFLYPPVSMAAHIGQIKMGYNEFNDYFEFCSGVAMGANFGYELDLSCLSDNEREQMKKQIEFYKSIRSIIQFGDFYRLEQEYPYMSWEYVSKACDKIICFFYQLKSCNNNETRYVKLLGVDNHSIYKMGDDLYCGEALSLVGIKVPVKKNAYTVEIMVFEKQDLDGEVLVQ